MSRAAVQRLAAVGTLWSLVGQFSGHGIRLASNIVMARILQEPHAFGLMQLVNFVIRGLQMISDIGVGPSIVQHARGKDVAFLQTAWTIQVIRSVALAIIGIAIAYPMAVFLTKDEPQSQIIELAQLIAVASAVGFISAFQSTALHTAARDMAVRRLILMDLSISIVTLGCMVYFAWEFRSVWALVVGTAVTGLMRTALSHMVLPSTPHRFRWEPEAVKELMGFGRWVFISTLMTFLALQIDRPLIQKLFGDLALLGVYSIALQLATFPVDIAQGLSGSILMPMYARLKRDGKVPASVYNQVALLTSTLGGVVVAGMIGAGPAFIRIAYKGEFEHAARILPWFGLFAWIRVLQNNTASALLAAGRSRSAALGNTVKLVGMLILVPAAFFGAEYVWRDSVQEVREFRMLASVIAALSLTEVLKYAVLAKAAARQGLNPTAHDVRASMYLVGVAAVLLSTHTLFAHMGWSVWAEFFVCGFGAIALFSPGIVKSVDVMKSGMSGNGLTASQRTDSTVPIGSMGGRQLRINFILPTPDLSGGIKSNRLIAEALVRRGHKVTILYPAGAKPWPAPWRLRSMLKRMRQELDSYRGPRHHLLESTATIIPVMATEVHADDCPDADVTIGTWWETMHWARKYPVSKGVLAYFVRAHEIFVGNPERVKQTYHMPAKKLVISRYLQRTMAQEYGDQNAAVIPNGVDWTQFDAPPRGKQLRPTVGIQYSLAGFKDIATGLEALRLVKQELPDLRVIAFSNSARRKDHVLPEGTEFHIQPSQSQIPELYRSADCWVLCSVEEGFGMPGIEASACRCPVVSTRSGGPEDYVVDGVTGYLTPVRDARALADGILAVLRQSDGQWRAMSEAAYAKAHEFDWDRSAEKLEKVLVAEVEARERAQRTP